MDRGKGRAFAITGLLVMLASIAATGPALGKTVTTTTDPAGSTGATGATGPTIVCASSDAVCVSPPDGPPGDGPTTPVTHPPAEPPTCRVTAATCPSDRVLSNETTSTTWAYADVPSTVRESPTNSSARVATLRMNTEDGLPEVYIVLRRRQVGSTAWAQIRVPMRPNGSIGWVPLGSLSEPNRLTTQIVIDKASERLRLYRAGHLVFTAPVGIGTPNDPTPAGHFWIREGFPVRGDPAYGPYAFGTSDYSTTLTDWPHGGVIGIHGTDQPGLVPGRPSHGCVRMRNSDISTLARLVSVGTPLLIQ
jgi:lipoprotein-anchoring transpeptidase ErfK/SrfK